MQGKLVAQDPNDPPASELLKAIEAEKQRLHVTSSLRKQGSSEGKNLDSLLRGNDGMKIKPLPPIKPKEVPYELPCGWEWVRLGNICSYIQRGKGPNYVDFSMHRVVSQKCVRWYGLDIGPARYIDPISLEKYESFRFLRAGDLLWNSTGTGTIGRACIFPQELEKSKIVVDSHVTVVRSIKINSLFLWRWIQSPIVQNDIESSASGTTNQIELNTTTVVNQLMPLPPLPEQHRIVAKIDPLMAKCDELEKLRKERQEKRLAVHAAAIKQLLDNPPSFPRRRESSSTEELESHSPSTRGQACGDDEKELGSDGVSDSSWDFIQQHFGELYTVKENVAELRKVILQLAVMGRLVPQGPNDPPASELLKVIEAEKQRLHATSSLRRQGSSEGKNLDSRLRGNDGIKIKSLPLIKPEEVPYELPLGWEWVRLGNLTQVITKGSSPNWQGVQYTDKDKGILFITSENVGSYELLLEKRKYVEEKFNLIEPRSILKKRDILMNIVGASIGRTAMFDLDEVANINQAVAIIRLIKKLDHEYFLRFFNSQTCLSYMFDKQVDNARPNLSMGNIALFAIPLPPLPEQHRIVAKIDQLMALCDKLEQQINAANHKQSELLNAVMASMS